MAQNIEDLCEDKARAGEGQFAIAFALLQIAREQRSVAYALKQLGLGDAASPMGALEYLSVTLKDGLEATAEAIRQLNAED